MSYELQSVETLVDQVKGTTGFLKALISRKFALVMLILVVGAVVSKILLG